MRASFGIALVIMVVGDGRSSQLFGQSQQPASTAFVASTNTASAPQGPTLTLRESSILGLHLAEPDTNAFRFNVSKTTRLRVTGPLVQPLKAKTGAELSHRVVHLFSPFAKEQPAWQTAPTGPVNTRAWSTIVGWSPGRSAFPDEHFHEPPHLDLISIGIDKQP